MCKGRQMGDRQEDFMCNKGGMDRWPAMGSLEGWIGGQVLESRVAKSAGTQIRDQRCSGMCVKQAL